MHNQGFRGGRGGGFNRGSYNQNNNYNRNFSPPTGGYNNNQNGGFNNSNNNQSPGYQGNMGMSNNNNYGGFNNRGGMMNNSMRGGMGGMGGMRGGRGGMNPMMAMGGGMGMGMNNMMMAGMGMGGTFDHVPKLDKAEFDRSQEASSRINSTLACSIKDKHKILVAKATGTSMVPNVSDRNRVGRLSISKIGLFLVRLLTDTTPPSFDAQHREGSQGSGLRKPRIFSPVPGSKVQVVLNWVENVASRMDAIILLPAKTNLDGQIDWLLQLGFGLTVQAQFPDVWFDSAATDGKGRGSSIEVEAAATDVASCGRCG